MLSQLPLDDRLNRLFYINGSLCRLVFSRYEGRCAFRREAPYIPFAHAVRLIGTGELLWGPPDRFDQLDDDRGHYVVRREGELLRAFLRSPVGRRLSNRAMRTRVEARLGEVEAWLVRRTLAGGAADALDDGGDSERR
jgi:hypothetical protein